MMELDMKQRLAITVPAPMHIKFIHLETTPTPLSHFATQKYNSLLS